MDAGPLGRLLVRMLTAREKGRVATMVPPTPEQVAQILAGVRLDVPDPEQALRALVSTMMWAAYWQPPDTTDRVAATPQVRAALARMASAILASPSLKWWGQGADLDRQWVSVSMPSSQWMEDYPDDPVPEPREPEDPDTVLATWRHAVRKEEEQFRRYAAEDPSRRVGGPWWSTPPRGLASSTRALAPGLMLAGAGAGAGAGPGGGARRRDGRSAPQAGTPGIGTGTPGIEAGTPGIEAGAPGDEAVAPGEGAREPGAVDSLPLGVVCREDEGGETRDRGRRLLVTPTPRVFEISGPQDWIALCRRFPLDVSASRRSDWEDTTGRTGEWVIPDWQAVAGEWDGVHLGVWGYLTTAGRALDVGQGRASVLAGWDPDRTWWFRGVGTAGPVIEWEMDTSAPEVVWRRVG